MKVLGINGSGRAGGNIAVLVKGVLEGAKEAGADTSYIELAGLKLQGCRACKACKGPQCCVLEDDMSKFYELAPKTDVLVLASPIYLDHVTGQMMTFIQRIFRYSWMKPEQYLELARSAAEGGAEGIVAFRYDYLREKDWPLLGEL